ETTASIAGKPRVSISPDAPEPQTGRVLAHTCHFERLSFSPAMPLRGEFRTQRLGMPKRAGNADRDRELSHLKEADRHIAAVNKRIARQRVIVQAAIDKARPSIEAQSLLQAFEASRRALEKHRQLVLDLLQNAGRPSRPR